MSKYLMVCGMADCPRPYGFCEACVRAEERERIAQAIEAREADTSPLHPARDAVLAAYRVAARIARHMTYQDVVNDELGGPCGQRSTIAPTLWCDKHDSRWMPRATYCDVYDGVLGLAQDVDEQARVDERERIAQALEAERDRQMRLAKAINNGRDRYVARATLSAFDPARIARSRGRAVGIARRNDLQPQEPNPMRGE